jgi:hypothetical protein
VLLFALASDGRLVGVATLRYVFLLLMGLPLLASADPAVSTFMHRIDAGSFDSTGWALAESTNGGFSVRMPGPFNDFTVSGDPAGVAERMEGLGGKAPNGTVFTAIRLFYKTKGTASSEFEKFKNGEGLPSAKVTATTVAGLAALDISYADDATAANERVILAGEDLVTLTIQAPLTASAPAQAMYQPFADSFRMLTLGAPRKEDPSIWQHDQLNEGFMRKLTKDICMKKTLATLSRSGCATQQCLAAVGGATGNCVTWASGDTAKFCATYQSQYMDTSCGAGGLDAGRCTLLNAVKRGICDKQTDK